MQKSRRLHGLMQMRPPLTKCRGRHNIVNTLWKVSGAFANAQRLRNKGSHLAVATLAGIVQRGVNQYRRGALGIDRARPADQRPLRFSLL